MRRLRQKQPRLALDADEYDVLKKRVLDRDGWKCQHCGTSKNLQVHHVVPRSRLGWDELDNLMSLCACCHWKQHKAKKEGIVATV